MFFEGGNLMIYVHYLLKPGEEEYGTLRITIEPPTASKNKNINIHYSAAQENRLSKQIYIGCT